MAVQAQHPSNILLLNRNGQEGLDYSLQTQAAAGGGAKILDQPQMLFNNNGAGTTNPRKRGREVAASPPINSFHMQAQPPQLIDLAKLHNHHHRHHQNVVSTGLRLSSANLNQQQQQQQQNQNHHNIAATQSSSFFSLFSEDISTHFKHQQDEIDQFFQAQGESLRRALAEKRQRHYRALLSAAEETIARRLREKEAEMEKATRRNSELAARAEQLTMEAQAWQAKARAQEATSASLQAQLHQAMISGQRPEEGGLVSGGVEAQAEDAESAYIDPDRVMISGPSCKTCRKRIASVVLLPCRHLCLCTECDQVVQACPICLTIRNSSVEVYLT